jgi:hypothetical protein
MDQDFVLLLALLEADYQAFPKEVLLEDVAFVFRHCLFMPEYYQLLPPLLSSPAQVSYQ